MKKRIFLLPLLTLSMMVSGCKTEESSNENNENNEQINETNENNENKNEDNPVNPIVPKATYTITWNNYDNTLLSQTTVEEGAVPTYSGTPTRAATDEYTYTFSGWTPEVVTAVANATYTATFEEKAKPRPIELSTIADVRELCKSVTNLNEAGIGIDTTVRVKIQGWAFHKMTLVKTAKKYGYNVSYPNKVFLGDSTGYIACASNNAQGSLYYKVNDWAGNENSKYEVIGYISMYMNQPEIYVPDNDSDVGYTYDASLNVTCDLTGFAVQKTVSEYYNDFNNVCYNCAGHGYRDIISIKGVEIDNVVNANTYIGHAGGKAIKFKKGICGLSKGTVCNVVGLVEINNYIPSIVVIDCVPLRQIPLGFSGSYAIEKTIPEFISEFSSLPYDDTDRNMGDVIKKFQNVYKVTGYISAYNTNGKLYVTLEPSYNTAKEYPTRENAICVRKAITLRNDNCWNTTEEEIIRFAAVGGYLNEDVPVSLYITPILYENMTYSKVKYHEMKNYVFESLVPEFEVTE